MILNTLCDFNNDSILMFLYNDPARKELIALPVSIIDG